MQYPVQGLIYFLVVMKIQRTFLADTLFSQFVFKKIKIKYRKVIYKYKYDYFLLFLVAGGPYGGAAGVSSSSELEDYTEKLLFGCNVFI